MNSAIQDAVELAKELPPVSALIRKPAPTTDPELATAWEVTMVTAIHHQDVYVRAEAIQRLFDLHAQMVRE